MDSSVLRAFHAIEENADPDTITTAMVQGPILSRPKEAGQQFRKFIEAGAVMQTVMPDETQIIDCLNPSMPPAWQQDGRWKVEWHRPMGATIWRPQDVGLWRADQQKTGTISGRKLRDIIKNKDIPVLPDALLDFLLANPVLIPEEWKGLYVFFWGTGYRSPGGGLYVRCLNWNGTAWNWNYNYLDNDWDAYNPALVLASLPLAA